MSTHKSALSRAIQYFKDADYEEAMVAQVRVVEIMSQRTRDEAAKRPVTRRVYKKRAAVIDGANLGSAASA